MSNETKNQESTINYQAQCEQLSQQVQQLQTYVQQLELTIRVLSNLLNR